MNNNLFYILIGLIVLFGIIIFFMRGKKAQPTRPVATPVPPTKPKAVEEQTPVTPTVPNQDRVEVAKSYIQQNKFDDATELLTQGLAAEPNNSNYMLQLLQLYAMTNQSQKFDHMYQTIQSKADMLTLQQAKEIKQEYGVEITQPIDDTGLTSNTLTVTNEPINSAEEGLAFDLDDDLSLEDDLATVYNTTTTSNHLETEELLSTSIEEEPLTFSTAQETTENSDDAFISFDDLESQLLDPQSDEDFGTPVVENDLTNENEATLHLNDELALDEFNLDEEITKEAVTEENTVNELTDDLVFEIEANPTHVADAVTADNELTTDNPVALEAQENDDFGSLLEEVNSKENTLDQIELESKSESDLLDFTLDDELETAHETNEHNAVLETDALEADFLDIESLETGSLEETDLLETDSVEPNGLKTNQTANTSAADDDLGALKLDDTDDIVLDWDEPLEEGVIIAQPTVPATDIPEATIESTDKADLQNFDLDDSSLTSDTIADGNDQAIELNSDGTAEEDTIFGEGVSDTISQLDALDDFDFDFDSEAETAQTPAISEPASDSRENFVEKESLESDLEDFDISAPTQAPVTPEMSSDTAQQKPTTETLASPSVAEVDNEEFTQAFDFVEQLDKDQITLDLAEQYLDLGEYESAKRLVNEVITSSANETHKNHAQTLLERMH